MNQNFYDENDSDKIVLSAVNTLIHTINEMPFETIEEMENNQTAQLALFVINETKRDVLGMGWDFSSDYNYPFVPDENGKIGIPYNVLDITGYGNRDIVMRQWQLYDRAKRTNIFTETIYCDVIWDIPFNEITHPIRNYITLKASRTFQARTIGDSNAFAYSDKELEDAYTSARQSESRTGQYNILKSINAGSMIC